MIILEKSDYSKILPLIKKVPINVMFIELVLLEKAKGQVFVNNRDSPTCILIRNPNAASLLFGNPDKEIIPFLLNYILNKDNSRDKHEWLEVFPESWHKILKDILGSKLIRKVLYFNYSDVKKDKKILEFQRINYSFNKMKYLKLRESLISNEYKIKRMDKEAFKMIEGEIVPKHFWNDENEFYNKGIGFALFNTDNLPISTAFSACIIDKKIEIGVETKPEYRKKNLAFYVCCALIDYFIKNSYEPIWSCQSSNIGSQKLARRLGFEEKLRYPNYRLLN